MTRFLFLLFLFVSLVVVAQVLIWSPDLSPKTIWDRLSHKIALGNNPAEKGCFAFEHINTKKLGQYDPSERLAYFDNKQVPVLGEDVVAQSEKDQKILGAHQTPTGEEKWIEIDLSEQKLRAWEGARQVFEYLISSGKSSTPTPEGEYRIWVKLRYTKMEGGSRARGDYYYLPNVPWVMYFYKGYGIHGAYWHMKFGTPVSHGCVNMQINDAGNLFNWAAPTLPSGKSVVYPSEENPGTRVVVHR